MGTMDKEKGASRLSLERQQEIQFLLKEHGHLSVSELAQHFNVSEMTIRRDLKVLASMGLIQREHGGAVYPPSGPEDLFFNRLGEAEREKTEIAKIASSLINPGDSIILDAGTTALAIARALTVPCTVVTNSLPIATFLTNQKEISVLLTGGEVRESTYALVGPIARATLESFNIDKLFLGATGLSLERGLTTTNLAESEVKQEMIRASKEVIVVAHSLKFTRVYYHTFAQWEQIHTLITDNALPQSLKEGLMQKGVRILTP